VRPGRSLGRDEADACPVGVDSGRAWLTLELVRALGLRADDEETAVERLLRSASAAVPAYLLARLLIRG
jgi:hypothetical protein